MSNRKLIREMKERGWTCETTRGNHLKFTHIPSGEFVHHSCTPSDHRGLKNMMARVKRIEREFEEKQQLIAAE